MKTKAKGILFRCPAGKHQALRAAARAEGVSLQRLLDRLTDAAVAERAAHARFRLLLEEGRSKVAEARRLLQEIQRRHVRAAEPTTGAPNEARR
ncbi:MAG TPA: hypothetical protein PKE47_03295, partial [Verrucomicrobiota bacterium]|nr:hypothetical protein [Verrucomicrobiota bacterium]